MLDVVLLNISFNVITNAILSVTGLLNSHTFLLLACSLLCPLEAVSLVAGLPCFPPVLHHLVMFTDGTSPGIKFFSPCILTITVFAFHCDQHFWRCVPNFWDEWTSVLCVFWYCIFHPAENMHSAIKQFVRLLCDACLHLLSILLPDKVGAIQTCKNVRLFCKKIEDKSLKRKQTPSCHD